MPGSLIALFFSCKSQENREPTSGLEPLTCSLRVRCALGPEGLAGYNRPPMTHATRNRSRLRQRIRLVVLALVAVCSLGSACAPLPGVLRTPDDPNVVLILTDDLDVGLLQRYKAHYPNLGELAAEGTTFQNAFVTDSLCCPSRATILRGQYAHNHHIVGNWAPQGGAEKFRDSSATSGTRAPRWPPGCRTKATERPWSAST